MGLGSNDPSFAMSWEDWWNLNLAKDDVATSFGTICWMLWKSRNERISEGKHASVEAITERHKFRINLSRSAVAELILSREDSRNKKEEREIGWVAAVGLIFTLNTDGCWSITHAGLQGS
ncbi:hypothetical protein LINPERHAP2_LOCUS20734 [Linum perenne]